MPQTPKAKLKSLNVPSVQDPSTHKVTYTRWPSAAERWPTPMCRQPICPVLSSLGLGRLVCRKRSANVCSHLALLVFARRHSWSLACRFLCTKQRSPFVLDEQRPHVCLSHLHWRSTKLSDVWTSALALLLICRRSRWLKPGQHNIGDRQET